MKTRFGWITGAALALALAGQVGYYSSQPATVELHASWANKPKSLNEAKGKAKAIVLAEVVAAEQGEDLVTPVKGEPNDEDRIPTQKVTLRVLKGYKGARKSGETVTLFQTGGLALPPAPKEGEKAPMIAAKQVILEGDPLYQVGEKYVLMLEEGPRGMQRTISPEGRYRLTRGDQLEPMIDSDVAKEVRGKPLAQLEKDLAGN